MKKFIFIIMGGIVFSCTVKFTPIKLGVIVPLQGELAGYGKLCLEGIQLGLEVINEKKGIKRRKLTLVIKNNKGEKEKTYQVIKELNSEGVVGVIGPLTTENTKTIGDYVDSVGLPIITPTATGVDATKNKEWVWRISFTDDFQGKTLAKFLAEKLKITKVILMLDINDSYSVGLARSFEEEFERRGGKVIEKLVFEIGEKDFSDQIEKIKKLQPEAVFISGFCQEAGYIIKQARKRGIKIPFIGGDGWDSPQLVEMIKETEGVNYYSTHFFYNYGGEEVQKFLKLYQQKYKRKPHTFAALGYDAIMVMYEALKKSEKLTRANLNSNIKKVKKLGLTGTIDFTTSKDPRRSIVVLKLTPPSLIEVVYSYY